MCGRVLQLVGAYCYEIFVAEKAPAVQQQKAVPVAVKEKESTADTSANESAVNLKRRKAAAATASS